MMKTIVLMLSFIAAVLGAGGPALPTCHFGPGNCAFLWVGNYVPSITAPNFDFYLDNVLFRNNVAYAATEVVACNCSASYAPFFGIGSSLVGAQDTTTRIQPFSLVCDRLYSFFASRKANLAGGIEQYQVTVTPLYSPTGVTFMSGITFHLIYRSNPATITVRYCDENTAVCDATNGRTTANVALGQATSNTLKVLGGFQNPIRITGAQRTLFDDTVSGSVGDFHVFLYYGDQQNEASFPVSGGLSSASTASISMALLAVLSVIVVCFF
jgi:hypothetical protein